MVHQFEAHIESCESCAREFELLRKLDRTLRDEPMEVLPGDLAAAVSRRLAQGLSYSWRDVVVAASIALVLSLFWLAEYFLGGPLVRLEGVDTVKPLLSMFEMGEMDLGASFAETQQLAAESYRAVCGYVTAATTNVIGGLAMIVLLTASALLAIGTNAVVFRQARIRRLTPDHL